MKKAIVIFLLLTLSISGCTHTEGNLLLDEKFDTEEYLAAYDVPKEYLTGGVNILARNDTVYYVNLSDWLYYYDDQIGVSGRLCSKAECTHDNKNCNAYIGNVVSGLQVYDGHIYWINGSALTRVDLSGENREVVQNLSVFSGMFPRFYIHRGYVYTGDVQNKVEAGKAFGVFSFKQFKLGDKEDKGKDIYTCQGNIYNYLCAPYKNQIYFLVCEQTDSFVFNSKIYEYGVADGELRLLKEELSEWSVKDMYVDDNGLHMAEIGYMNGYSQRVRYAHTDLKSGEKTIRKEIVADGEMRIFSLAPEIIAAYTLGSGSKEDISPYKIYDWDGNLLFAGEYDGSSLYCIGADETGVLFRQLYLEMTEEGESTFYWKINRASIDGAEVLIDFVERNEDIL